MQCMEIIAISENYIQSDSFCCSTLALMVSRARRPKTKLTQIKAKGKWFDLQ